MANDIDDEIVYMKKYKLQLEGHCKYFNGLYSELSKANKAVYATNREAMKRYMELMKAKTPNAEIYKDKNLIEIYTKREKQRQKVKSLKKMAQDKQYTLVKLGREFDKSIKYVKKKLKDRKNSKNPFKNPNIEKRANKYLDEVNKMWDNLRDTETYIIRIPDL